MKNIKTLHETMADSKIPSFFKRATGRKYTNKETCVNDIRRNVDAFFGTKTNHTNPLNTEHPIFPPNNQTFMTH